MAHRRRGVGVGRTRANARPGGPPPGQRRTAAAPSDASSMATTLPRGGGGDRLLQKTADEMHARSIQTAVDTIETLQIKLGDFAKKHQSQIQDDPAFRQQFLQMCAPLGVDPLVSQKGFWAKALGVGIGDFYYELSVKVAEVCFATRTKNGGIMAVTEVVETLNKVRGGGGGRSKSKKKDLYSAGDVAIAVQKLGTLGGGFRIVTVGTSDMIVSVPTELDNDHVEIMGLAQDGKGCVTVDEASQRLSWSADRVERGLQLLLHEGMVWKDDFHGIAFYWFPSVWKEQQGIIAEC